MSISYFSDSAPESQLPIFPRSHTTPSGRRFDFEVAVITRQCIVLTALHNGHHMTFESVEAMDNFYQQLKGYLNRRHAIPLLPAPAIIALPAPKIAGLLPAGLLPAGQPTRAQAEAIGHTDTARMRSELMARYPAARTPNEAHTMAMDAYLASQPKHISEYLTPRERAAFGQGVQ